MYFVTYVDSDIVIKKVIHNPENSTTAKRPVRCKSAMRKELSTKLKLLMTSQYTLETLLKLEQVNINILIYLTKILIKKIVTFF